jgi:RNA polymerase sigma factor (sigma-70 family)
LFASNRKLMVDDATLIRRIQAGDRHAFQWLIKSHQRLVYGIVWKIVRNQTDTEDISQEVFLKVYEKLGTFQQESRLSTWIAKIAYNQALSHLRKRDILHHPVEVDDEAFREQIRGEGTPTDHLEAEELKTVVHQAIEQLPQPYRTLIDLFHIQEMSYAEVVEISGLPEGTVKSYLFRGRKLLKDAISGSRHLIQ